MARIVVLLEARDRPGLLNEAARVLAGLGCNIDTSLGYRVDGEARILFIASCEEEPGRVVERLREALESYGAEVRAAEVGPDAAPLVAEFLLDKPAMATVLEPYLEPPDLLDALLRLPREARVPVYGLLSSHSLAGMLKVADEDTAREIAESLPPERLAEAVARLEPSDAVDVLQKLPEEKRREVLQRLPEKLRRELQGLLRYPPESAGGVMTTSFPMLLRGARVEDALQLLRSRRYDITDTLAVVDEKGHLVGLVPVDELLRATPGERVERLARRPRATIEPGADREEAARLMLRYDIKRLPVVDEEGRLLGIIGIEDVAHVLAEEAAEDIAKLSGIAEKPRERYLHATVSELVRLRLPWLLLIYVIESVTASIIKSYEDVIQRIAVAAAFIPLIMDTGGNVGSQASSTIIRALALGEISERHIQDIVYTILKELATAAVIGLILAGLGFSFAYIIGGGHPRLALSIALTLFIVVVFSDLIGATLPIIARRLGLDPATISSPFVTTIVDVSVAVIYLNLVAKLVLGL